MTDYAPAIAAILSGILIPLMLLAFRWLKRIGTGQVEIIEARIMTNAQAIETRLSLIIQKGNTATDEALLRLEAMNGKVADVIARQAVDHDRVLWLLGAAGHSIEEKKEQP